MLQDSWLNGDRLLGPNSPLPLDAPFTPAMAEEWGVSRNRLSVMHRQGLVRQLVRGVYAASQCSDHVALRASALALVLPESAVVTDRTAAWLHGAEVFTRGERASMPVQCFEARAGHRLRRGRVDSGERALIRRDIVEIEGVRATSALRTTCDLARLLWRFDALGAIDAMIRAGVSRDQLVAELPRFRGYRGIRQARGLAPLGDGRAESMPESALRLHWIEAGLPTPQLQIWVRFGGVATYRLDVGDEGIGYAAEYDGVEFHSGPTRTVRDQVRRRRLHDDAGWVVDVFTNRDVYAPNPKAPEMLRAGYYRARRTVGVRGWL